MRIRAHAVGANYVVLEMETGGPTRVEGTSEGHQTSWEGRTWSTESSVTAETEVALWGTAFVCPEAMIPDAPAGPARCNTHADCPLQQFCAPPGHCRQP